MRKLPYFCQMISQTLNWIDLDNLSMLQKLHDASLNNADSCFIVFKHSTRCGTSRTAKKMFENEWNSDGTVYLVNVIQSKDVSTRIEGMYDVSHESPQVLVIKNGKCVHHNSHHNIDAQTIIQLIIR